MFKITKRLFFIPLLIISVNAFADELQVATSEWIPYVGKELPNQGLAMDIVNRALIRAGHKPAVTIQAWTRTLEGADIGVYDLIAAAWYSKEREKSFIFSKPYIFNEIKLLKHADSSFDFNRISDLEGKTIGVITGYAYGEQFDRAQGLLRAPGIHVLQNINRVINRELDLTLDDERVLNYEIKHNISLNTEKLIFLPKSVSKNGLHIAVSRQNPKHKEIVQAFDKAILEMKKDGTYERILKLHSE